MTTNEQLAELLRDLVQAETRTTHAVRAIAKFILIQATYALVAALVYLFSPSGSSTISVGVIFAIVIAGIGFIHATISANGELSESKPLEVGRPLAKVNYEESNRFWLENELNVIQYQAWQAKGKPSLQNWLSAGKPDFVTWLESQ